MNNEELNRENLELFNRNEKTKAALFKRNGWYVSVQPYVAIAEAALIAAIAIKIMVHP